jgi:hypothetical protein
MDQGGAKAARVGECSEARSYDFTQSLTDFSNETKGQAEKLRHFPPPWSYPCP